MNWCKTTLTLPSTVPFVFSMDWDFTYTSFFCRSRRQTLLFLFFPLLLIDWKTIRWYPNPPMTWWWRRTILYFTWPWPWLFVELSIITKRDTTTHAHTNSFGCKISMIVVSDKKSSIVDFGFFGGNENDASFYLLERFGRVWKIWNSWETTTSPIIRQTWCESKQWTPVKTTNYDHGRRGEGYCNYIVVLF